MKKLYVIVGRTCSGKDTLAKKMCGYLGFRQAITYTNRKKRDDETEGVEHYFVTTDKIQDMIYKDKRADNPTVFSPTHIGRNYYCTTYNEIKKSDIIILDTKGVLDVIHDKNIKRDLEIVYLNTSKEDREERSMLFRSDHKNFQNRCEKENINFNHFERYFERHNYKKLNKHNKKIKYIVLAPNEIDGYISSIK